ncbi:MAG TPA: hypothetical protein ENN12_02445 [Epsilonproteobacteria bacterium]|nr:hypothetical protein [Campylobacterota bacterium]
MIYTKIKRLSKKIFSSKTYLLAGLNRVIDDDLGKITDITVDREDKNIYLELEKKQEFARLDVLGYGIVYKGNKAYLTFKSIQRSGYLQKALQGLDVKNQIAINPLYIKIVEKIL